MGYLRRTIPGLHERLDVLNSVNRTTAGEAFVAGSSLVSSTDHIRGMLDNPTGSGVNVFMGRIIIAHDQSGVLPGRIVKEPDTNRPTTAITSLNHSLAHSNTSGATVYVDSGLEMTGSSGGAFLPTVGTVPGDLVLQTPFLIPPGSSLGLDMDVGGNLTSADVMLLVAWIEKAI